MRSFRHWQLHKLRPKPAPLPLQKVQSISHHHQPYRRCHANQTSKAVQSQVQRCQWRSRHRSSGGGPMCPMIPPGPRVHGQIKLAGDIILEPVSRELGCSMTSGGIRRASRKSCYVNFRQMTCSLSFRNRASEKNFGMFAVSARPATENFPGPQHWVKGPEINVFVSIFFGSRELPGTTNNECGRRYCRSPQYLTTAKGTTCTGNNLQGLVSVGWQKYPFLSTQDGSRMIFLCCW